MRDEDDIQNDMVNGMEGSPAGGTAYVPPAFAAPEVQGHAYHSVPGVPKVRRVRRRRISRWFRHHVLRDMSWQIPIALASIVLGVMVGMQYRSLEERQPALDDRRNTLELVRTLEAERNKLSADLSEIRGRMSELEESAGKRESLSQQMQEQLNRSRMEACLTGMKGPGVVVELSDSPRSPGLTEDAYFFIVHDVDLQALVNEMWSAGAEAVSINDQRVVARTSIRCVGPAILVNGVRLTAPYTVRAIGPGDLETALRMPGGFLDSMSPLIARGGQIKVNRSSEMAIAPYEGSLSFRYGQPFEKSKESPAVGK